MRLTGRTAALLLWLVSLVLWLAVPLAAARAEAAPDAGGRRLALVVGNSNYAAVYPLKNAAPDSTAVAGTLESLGFEVTHLTDASLAQMKAAVDNMAAQAEKGGVEATLFYFSGHGFQLSGANYIVPVDAVLDNRDAIAQRTLRLDDIISKLNSKDRQTIILLDACRDNPLPASVRRPEDVQGLAIVTTGVNTYTVFATAPGGVTADGNGDSGPFAQALVDNMLLPDIPISAVMMNVRNAVLAQTHDLQDPWGNDTLRSPFYFNRGEQVAGVNLGTDNSSEGGFDAGVSFGTVQDSAATQPVQVSNVSDTQVKLPTGTAIVVAPTPTQTIAVHPTTLETSQPTIATQPGPVETVKPGTTTPTVVSTGPATPTTVDAGKPAVTQEAALETPVSTLAPLATTPDRIIGTDVSPDEDNSATPPVTPIPTEPKPEEVALAVQDQLHRLGCYTGGIDGNWDKASRNALKRYFDGKKLDVADTDPSAELLTRLVDEKAVVCKAEQVVATPKPPKAKPATPKPQVATTPEPAPTAPKIKLGGPGSGTFR